MSPLAGSLDFKTVDILVRFPPNKAIDGKPQTLIHTHKHCGQSNQFVLAGEHHIYETDHSTLREVRPAGYYSVSTPGDIHTECGGPDGAIVHYSVRGTGNLFEFVDKDMNIQAALTLEDLVAGVEAGRAEIEAAR